MMKRRQANGMLNNGLLHSAYRFYNIEELNLIYCGEPVLGMHPAIVEWEPKRRKAQQHFCPVLVDKVAGVVVLHVPFAISQPEAFDAANRMAEKLKGMESI